MNHHPLKAPMPDAMEVVQDAFNKYCKDYDFTPISGPTFDDERGEWIAVIVLPLGTMVKIALTFKEVIR